MMGGRSKEVLDVAIYESGTRKGRWRTLIWRRWIGEEVREE